MDIIDSIIRSGKSINSVVVLYPGECNRIIREYEGAKTAWRQQVDCTMQLRACLADLQEIADEVSQNQQRESLAQIVSEMKKEVTSILEQASKVYDHLEELASTTKLLK